MQNGATSSDKEVAFMRIMAEDLLGRSGGVRERVQEFSFKISAATLSIVTNRIRIHYGGSRQLPSNPLGHIYTRARAHTSTHTHTNIRTLGKSGCAEVRRSQAASALDWLCCGPPLCVCPPLGPPVGKGSFSDQVDSPHLLSRSCFFVFIKAVEPSPPRA